MACHLSNCSTPIYFHRKTLTFRVETGRQLERRDTRGLYAEAQNGYDGPQKDQAIYTNINGDIQLPTVTAGQKGLRAVPSDIENVILGTANNNEGRNVKLCKTPSLSNREVVVDWLLD